MIGIVSLALIAWVAAALQVWVVWKNVTTGQLKYYQQTYDRTHDPFGFWSNVGARILFFLIFGGVGAFITYTLL